MVSIIQVQILDAGARVFHLVLMLVWKAWTHLFSPQLLDKQERQSYLTFYVDKSIQEKEEQLLI